MKLTEENKQETPTVEDSSKDSDTPRQHIPRDRMNEDSLEYYREVNRRAMELLADMEQKGLLP